jgi:hypothetical protein
MPLSANDDCFNPTRESPTDDSAEVTRFLPPCRSAPSVPLPAWTLCTPTPASAPGGTLDPAWLEFMGVDAAGAGTPPDDPWLELLRR